MIATSNKDNNASIDVERPEFWGLYPYFWNFFPIFLCDIERRLEPIFYNPSKGTTSCEMMTADSSNLILAAFKYTYGADTSNSNTAATVIIGCKVSLQGVIISIQEKTKFVLLEIDDSSNFYAESKGTQIVISSILIWRNNSSFDDDASIHLSELKVGKAVQLFGRLVEDKYQNNIDKSNNNDNQGNVHVQHLNCKFIVQRFRICTGIQEECSHHLQRLRVRSFIEGSRPNLFQFTGLMASQVNRQFNTATSLNTDDSSAKNADAESFVQPLVIAINQYHCKNKGISLLEPALLYQLFLTTLSHDINLNSDEMKKEFFNRVLFRCVRDNYLIPICSNKKRQRDDDTSSISISYLGNLEAAPNTLPLQLVAFIRDHLENNNGNTTSNQFGKSDFIRWCQVDLIIQCSGSDNFEKYSYLKALLSSTNGANDTRDNVERRKSNDALLLKRLTNSWLNWLIALSHLFYASRSSEGEELYQLV